MKEYNCICCSFKTPIKSKYESHLKTNKHLSNVTQEEAPDNKDLIIQNLREEICFLKGKVEAYELMMKCQRPEKNNEVSLEDLKNYNSTDFVNSLELEVNEPLVESVAELRMKDDEVLEINLNNAFDSFVNNEKNNLPFIKEFAEFQTNPNIIGDIVIEHVLNKCSVQVTEQYKGRFKIYKDKWLSVQESTDLLYDLISPVKSHFQNYLKLFKHYYSFDSKLRCLDQHKATEIKPFLQQLQRKIIYSDYDELIKYILKEIQE